MSARDLEMDLPFWVNGTLDGDARAALDAALAEDARLAGEAEALGAIRDGMQAEDVRSPGEFGLARLMRDVAKEAAVAAPVPQVVPLTRRPWVWQAAAAVALAALVGQTMWSPRGAEQAAGRATGFELAGAAVPGALAVAFVPGTTEEALRAVLLDAGLEIVSGPSALGFYRLDLPGSADDAAALAAAEAVLRAAENIVETVENVD